MLPPWVWWSSSFLEHSVYTFLGSIVPYQNSARCKLHVASKSCVLLHWQRYCMALKQWAWAKFCGVVQGMELRNCRSSSFSTEGATYIPRAAITFGIGPHSSYAPYTPCLRKKLCTVAHLSYCWALVFSLFVRRMSHWWTNFDDLYVIWGVSAQGHAFWGSQWDNALFMGSYPPPNLNFGAWIGVFKPNSQNLKRAYYRNYCIDSKQILHSDKNHQCHS